MSKRLHEDNDGGHRDSNPACATWRVWTLRTPASEDEETTLYTLVQEHVETFFAQVERETGAGLPKFAKDEFEAFLECGRHCQLEPNLPSFPHGAHQLKPAKINELWQGELAVLCSKFLKLPIPINYKTASTRLTLTSWIEKSQRIYF